MMESLIAGGMDASYSPTRSEKMNERWGEKDAHHPYKPNTEYFELDPADYLAGDFPKGYEDKLIKCLWRGCAIVAPSQNYRCIYMRRPREEIRRSLVAFFGGRHKETEREDFDASVDRMVAVIRDRRSFLSVDEIWYAEVLDDPLRVFTRLADNGWPVDPYSAAKVPSRQKMRQVA